MYVYEKSEAGLWTVGFYKPDGTWVPESDYQSCTGAAGRVNYLNGGGLVEADVWTVTEWTPEDILRNEG